MEHMEELRRARAALAVAAEKAGRAVVALSMLEASRAFTAAEQSAERFEHTDNSGGGLQIDPLTNRPGLKIQTTECPVVFLDQDVVNRLAQYLDHYRTDLIVMTDATPAEVVRESVSEAPQCPWAFLHDKEPGKPYKSYDRCELVAGHTSFHKIGDVKWQSNAPQAFRTDQPGMFATPAEVVRESVSEVPGYRRCSHGEATGSRCRRLAGHDGVHVPRTEDKPSPAMDNDDPVEMCAGHMPDVGNHIDGCAHTRGQHGLIGCLAAECPCTQSYGR